MNGKIGKRLKVCKNSWKRSLERSDKRTAKRFGLSGFYKRVVFTKQLVDKCKLIINNYLFSDRKSVV